MSGTLADLFSTRLTPEDEAAFQQWRATLPPDLQNMEDYDLRGAWKGLAPQNGRAHMPDTWKKPNHITFSEGSMYSGKNGVGAGGKWVDADPEFRGEEQQHPWVFWASPENVKQHGAKTLADYFRRNEPASALVLPFDYRLPRQK